MINKVYVKYVCVYVNVCKIVENMYVCVCVSRDTYNIHSKPYIQTNI